MAIAIGTNDYQAAQKLANKLQAVASYTRRNENSSYQQYFDPFYSFISDVKKLGVFASQIATTIDTNCKINGYNIANLSSKQAWILACAAIENNIIFNY